MYAKLFDRSFLEKCILDDKTNTEIAREIGCDISSVGIALKRLGIHSNRRSLDLSYEYLYRRIVLEGATIEQIARENGCTGNGVRYRAELLGIPIAPPKKLGRPELTEALNRLGSYREVAKELGKSTEHINRTAKEYGIDFGTDYPRVSSTEVDLRNFCSSLNKQLLIQESPLKWDLLFTQEGVAVELDGVYWHSEGVHRNKFNIRDKVEKSYELGIRSLHIFDVEWIHKRHICEGIIRSAVSAYTEVFYARKLKIKHISSQNTKDFLLKSHIQGWCVSAVNIGLVDDKDRLLICMTFGKSRNTNEEWELLRLCTLPGVSVVGGASRLYKFFLKNYTPKSVISYCSKRMFSGDIYEKLGFKYVRDTGPSYYYSKNAAEPLESRNKYQKHKLKSILSVYDESLTEYENMLNNKYRRVWDAGNKVFIWKA